jgi:hypothetical protein
MAAGRVPLQVAERAWWPARQTLGARPERQRHQRSREKVAESGARTDRWFGEAAMLGIAERNHTEDGAPSEDPHDSTSASTSPSPRA